MQFEVITAFICLAWLAKATPVPLEERASSSLNSIAVAAGKKFFGTATNQDQFNDASYVDVMLAQFGSLTPANVQKWQYTEPSQGSYDYSQGDSFASYAAENGKILCCDNLVWYQQYPSWIDSQSWTAESLSEVMTNHITSEVSHYKGKCYSWNVVNEAFNDDGTWRENVFYNTIGEDYIAQSFAAAAAADPNAILYYNDYNIESPGAKATAVENLISSLKSQGIKIDAVGLESHFIVGETPSLSQQQQQMQAYANLGVDVFVTELDVRFSSLPPTEQGLQQQSEDYQASVGACAALGSKCPAISVWDFDDTYSWIPSTFSGQGDADLYWANLTAKPALAGIESVLVA
ncbi:hypothetical protein AWJ20_1938 [Sugiyamaella lignohabitans]|uniref:Beta-xylanase n=1 Tax=Sugiyamaella lignohabitans TaxID=796027 RepID=A0A167E4U2_9ASCO|nr:uncharacterized protein AWJ20_1938 [Sugiyamaella lignohabitans]ANB13639.1 hypothetical protein AWJ20_1938 [Sugiyamaella lignohabitans]